MPREVRTARRFGCGVCVFGGGGNFIVFADSQSPRVTGLVPNSRISARPYTAVFLFARTSSACLCPAAVFQKDAQPPKHDCVREVEC